MKTIVHIETKLSKYIFGDDVDIVLTPNGFEIPDLIVLDITSENSIVVENVDPPPEEWRGDKWFYDNGWVLNEEWEDPFIPKEPKTKEPQT